MNRPFPLPPSCKVPHKQMQCAAHRLVYYDLLLIILRGQKGGMRIFNQRVPGDQTKSRRAPPSGSRLTLAADAVRS